MIANQANLAKTEFKVKEQVLDCVSVACESTLYSLDVTADQSRDWRNCFDVTCEPPTSGNPY